MKAYLQQSNGKNESLKVNYRFATVVSVALSFNSFVKISFLGLKQTRDNLLAQLNELSKKKRRGSAEENARAECEGLETKLNFLHDELVM